MREEEAKRLKEEHPEHIIKRPNQMKSSGKVKPSPGPVGRLRAR